MNPDGTWPLVSAHQMRALDSYTIEQAHVSADVLMESAGRAVVDALLSRFGALLREPQADILVVCGRGNNGGDGLVVARHLHLLGVRVRAVLVGDRKNLSQETALNWRRAEAVGVPLSLGPAALPEEGLVVDALFGTGLSRELEGEAAGWVDVINQASSERLRIVSIDIPSGIHGDTGQVLGCAVAADLTVTLGCAKTGLVLEPGREHSGQLAVARIGIVDALPAAEADPTGAECDMWSTWAAARRLPHRPAEGHKGRFGHTLVVAGSEGKAGAAALSATAALRAGAGLVTLACPRGLAESLDAKLTEVMVAPFPEVGRAQLAASGLKEILALAEDRDVLALGPGLGTHPETVALVLGLITESSIPLVVDADGLNALVGSLPALRSREGAAVLTPHPGEAARLLETSAAKINADRLGAARELSRQAGAIVLLKGAGSVIAAPEGRSRINPTGGAYLAAAGTGDVLTGMVAAFLGQGMDAMEAATLAAFLHGDAADRLAQRRGESGLLAGEIGEELPACMQALRTERGQDGPRSIPIESTLLDLPEP